MAQSLFWIGMKGAIATMVEACHICQRSKYQASTPAGLLQPLPIPNAIWEEISMDFIVGLPKSKGFDAVLVVVDRLSKYGHFIALRHPYTARTVAEQFIKEVVRLHGIPISIVSDRDSTFMSSFWQELFRLQGTQLKMSTAYHPETDGQTEVLNRTLETYLRCFVSEQPKGWHSYLSWAEYWYNTSFHTAAQKTPFEIVYGRPPPALTKFIPGETLVEAVAQDLMDRDEILKQLKFHLSRAQDHMTKFADRKRRPSLIQPGDWVYLKIRPHRQGSMPTRLHPKLAARYYGPYLVLKQVGAVAFKLQLPECARIHPVFHVSQLKRAVGGHVVEPELPKELEVDAALYQPESVLASRTITQHGEQIEQVLIKWQSKPAEEATWEDILLIKSQFPEFNLEDKVDVRGGVLLGPRLMEFGKFMEAVKSIFNPYFDKAIWFQNSSLYHFSMFHASHHIVSVPATKEEIEAEASSVEAIAATLSPLKIVLDRVVLTSTGVLLGCWQVISGTDPITVRAKLKDALPHAPEKQLYDAAILHTSFARLLGPPRASPMELHETPDHVQFFHELVNRLNSQIRGFKAVVSELWYVEEYDVLALALNGRMNIRKFKLGSP
ncbi:hypothetical protein RIF29_09972 [Crotalaria pallida]|uniref:Integrase catalytic domain-containing protein n=1 Tax=Crotalaria pallida TaxID=3830 RepID=A0AAN9FYJ6_CROPI